MGFGGKISALLLGGAAAILLSAGAVRAAACDAGVISLRGDWGQAQFSIEVADDAAERAQGLMHREAMARNAGMLFIYDAPQSVAFWMRNTLIALDMLFIDATGLVTAIHENAIPLDETAIPGGTAVQFVLEVNAGMTALLGIDVGTEVHHPGIDQDAAVWGCADK